MRLPNHLNRIMEVLSYQGVLSTTGRTSGLFTLKHQFESDIDLIYIALLFYKIQLILTNPSSIIINGRPALWLYKFPVYLLKSIGRDSYPLSSKT